MRSFGTFQPNRPATVARAKALRNAMTEPERRLWWALRHRLPAYKFRRQVVVGRFIVDFCALDQRLIVEVDGNQHGTDQARRYDRGRTALLESQGFRVIRFFNEDVLRSMDSVLDTIFAALTGQFGTKGAAAGPPPLTPPRKGDYGMHTS